MAKGKKGAQGAPRPKRISFDEFSARHEAVFAENEDLLLYKALNSGKNESVPLSSSSLFPADPESAATYRAWLASPGHRLTEELRDYWRVRLLAAAKRENSPEAFRYILESWLINLRILAPKGVFIPTRRPSGMLIKKPGRPISKENEQIYLIWEAAGKPSPSSNDLAQRVYGKEFTKANGTERRKLRNRCRNAIERALDRERVKLKNERFALDQKIAELKKRLEAPLEAAGSAEPKSASRGSRNS